MFITKTIAISLITSRLDCWNSLLYGIPSNDIFLNLGVFITAELGLSHGLFDFLASPTPEITSLACIIFKPRTIAYQAISSGEPSYLFSMLSLTPKPKELSSSGFHLLSVSRVKSHAGTPSFSIAVPTLWNLLTEHVKSSNSIVSFRHHLKTHLFRLAYASYVFILLSKYLIMFPLKSTYYHKPRVEIIRGYICGYCVDWFEKFQV